MPGLRLALIVANDTYDDPGLNKLEAPAYDAEALAEVLGDPGIGAFDVQILRNAEAQEIRNVIDDFFSDRSTEDLLLLHFSCHGLKNVDGELFLAARDTRLNRLLSTAVPTGEFLSKVMAASRAQRIALFLDCCYGGAFPRGMVVRAAGGVHVGDNFVGQSKLTRGRGRVVITASNAMQYAFEGQRLAENAAQPSAFTDTVVQALSTGEADVNGDGWVGVHELFAYVSDRISDVSPDQTPQMWSFGAQGEIQVAQTRVRRVTPAALEAELAALLNSQNRLAKFGLVEELRERVVSSDLPKAYAAWQALETLQGDDSRRVSDAADAARQQVAIKLSLDIVTLEPAESGTFRGQVDILGPPLARIVNIGTDADWLEIQHVGDHVLLVARFTGREASHMATLSVEGPLGRCQIPVNVSAASDDSKPDGPHGPITGSSPLGLHNWAAPKEVEEHGSRKPPEGTSKVPSGRERPGNVGETVGQAGEWAKHAGGSVLTSGGARNEIDDLRRTSRTARTVESSGGGARARPSRRVKWAVAGATAVLTVVAIGVLVANLSGGGGSTGTGAPLACGELNMAINPWVGSTASAHVVGHVATKELGCTVDYKELTEDVSWQGFATGEVDVVIESWGPPKGDKQYFAGSGDGSATDFGGSGNLGVIGWYVPPWLAEAHPDILNWKNLNEYAAEFATSDSGGAGQFLGMDPSFVQHDEKIISSLDMNFEMVFSGSEAASIRAFQGAEKNKDFLIGYFYEPHWLFADLPLKKVELPPSEDYPVTVLKKIVSTEWATSDSTAVDLVKKFEWTNDDQNQVAAYISEDGMSPEDAAARWVARNADKVETWLG
jgi:ABC-type proline/glycine betaine transport system substrate-binding protein/uncharacterized caspase-like protein